MSSPPSEARQRVVAAAAEMLARHGPNATSIREMAKRAKAPLGSTYHHFPNGKQQVVGEAVAYAGGQVGAILDRYLQAGPAAGLNGFMAMWREMLLRSGFRIGCPVLAVAVEEPIDEAGEDARQAAAQAFGLWEDKLAASLQAQGHDAAAAAGLATLIVAAAEGAIAICRARRSIEPFDRVSEQMQRLLSHPD